MNYLYAFILGGFICGLAEIIKNIFKLTTGHMTILFVVIGVVLDINNFYDTLIKYCGAGALLPITNFGHLLAHAGKEGYMKDGFIGIFTNMYSNASGGIVYTIFLSVLFALLFRPKR